MGASRLFSRAEIREASRRRLDMPLHTHSHRLPGSEIDAVAEEINNNRRTIEEVTG